MLEVLERKLRDDNDLTVTFQRQGGVFWATIVIAGQEYGGLGPSLELALDDLVAALQDDGMDG